MSFLLAFEAVSLVAFYIWHRAKIGKAEAAIWTITAAAWLGLAAGTAAEFWVYSHLPYGESNMRSVAFSVFSISDLLVGLGLLALGIMMRRRETQFRLVVLAFFAYLPLSILMFAVGSSIFLSPALVSITLAGVILRRSLMPATQEHANVNEPE